MLRLRPVLGAVVAVLFCAVLQGAVVSKVEADAWWLQATAVLQILTLPLAVAAGLLLGLAARAPALQARGVPAGVLAGVGLYLMPAVAALLPALPFEVSAWSLLAGWWLACRFWLARSPAAAGPARPGHLTALAGGAGLLAGVLGLVLAGPAPAIGGVPPAGRGGGDRGGQAPNLALVVLDTLRADRLGCYGYPRPVSPYLDSLAARGVRFSRAVSPGSHTPPSHASLFTGRLPSGHGVMGTTVGMPAPVPTLAGRLADHGYTTLGVVANFVLTRSKRFSQGFHLYDDSLACHRGLGAASMAVTRKAAVGRLAGRIPLGRHTASKLLGGFFRPADRMVRAEEVTKQALTHLDAAAVNGRPVFLFLNYMDVHSPYQAPGEDLDRFLEHDPGRFRLPLSGLAFHRLLHSVAEEIRQGEGRHAEELQALSDRYDGELRYLDRQLRPVVERLEAISGERGWLLVITSDHGEHFGEHREVGHGGTLFEEAVRVPLLVLGSGIAPGVVTEPVSLVDVPGTLLAAAGVAEPLPEADGGVLPGLPAAVLPARGAQQTPDRRLPTAERGDPGTRWLHPALEEVAVFQGRYKAFYAVKEGPAALRHTATFDLDEDPGEAERRSRPLDDSDASLKAWRELWLRRYLAGRRRAVATAGAGADEAALSELGYAGAAGG